MYAKGFAHCQTADNASWWMQPVGSVAPVTLATVSVPVQPLSIIACPVTSRTASSATKKILLITAANACQIIG